MVRRRGSSQVTAARVDNYFENLHRCWVVAGSTRVNADVPDLEVLFVGEPDRFNPIGVKGVGEVGLVGVAAAIANAVFHATGKRIRSLPITIDQLL